MPLSPVGAKRARGQNWGPPSWSSSYSRCDYFAESISATCRRFVIIHSDDAGMYPSMNQATIDAMERGLVSSCSILAACPAFDEFAQCAHSPGQRLRTAP